VARCRAFGACMDILRVHGDAAVEGLGGGAIRLWQMLAAWRGHVYARKKVLDEFERGPWVWLAAAVAAWRQAAREQRLCSVGLHAVADRRVGFLCCFECLCGCVCASTCMRVWHPPTQIVQTKHLLLSVSDHVFTRTRALTSVPPLQARRNISHALVIWLAVTRTRRLTRAKVAQHLRAVNGALLARTTHVWHDYNTGELEAALDRQLDALNASIHREDKDKGALSLHTQIAYMYMVDTAGLCARALKAWREQVQKFARMRRDILRLWLRKAHDQLRMVLRQWVMLITVKHALVSTMEIRTGALRLEDAFERWWGKVYLRAKAVWKVRASSLKTMTYMAPRTYAFIHTWIVYTHIRTYAHTDAHMQIHQNTHEPRTWHYS
jgi:hypothetical protein